MKNVFASSEFGVQISDGAGYQARFYGLWIGGGGDVAISYDGGKSFVIRLSVPGGAFLNVSGTYLGTIAQGTKATGIVAETWGPIL